VLNRELPLAICKLRRYSTRTVRILIIEDHLGIQIALGMAVELEGHEAVIVDCGEEALNSLSSDDFNLILLDLNTNGISANDFMNGLSKLVEAGAVKRPAVVVLSAAPSIEFETKRLGADRYLKKPFEYADLADLISKIAPQPEDTKLLIG
jgi:DNA-binding response OmpR family regulator